MQGVKTAATADERDSERHPRRRGRNHLAGFTGTVTAGLVLLALLVLAAQVWGWLNGHPGPGAGMVGGHVVAAAVAVAAQRVADRERGVRAAACQLLVGAVTLGVLLLFWWW